MANVYRFFNEQDKLLYVSLSLNVQQTNGHWFDDMAKISVERFENREHALAARNQIIQKEQPRYSRHHIKPKPKLPDEVCGSYVNQETGLCIILQPDNSIQLPDTPDKDHSGYYFSVNGHQLTISKDRFGHYHCRLVS